MKNGFRKRNKPCKSCSGCVYEMNIWIWLVKLPPFFSLPPFFFFSQLFERVLRAKRQVNGLGYTFFSFSFFQTSLHLRKESRPHVCLISRHKHKREKKISQFLLVLRRDTEGKINSGFQIFSFSKKRNLMVPIKYFCKNPMDFFFFFLNQGLYRVYLFLCSFREE